MTASTTGTASSIGAAHQLVSMVVAGQELGVRIHAVRDILGCQTLAQVPLAAPEIAGVLNLRGRIVTAIDLRRRLGIGGCTASAAAMNVVVEHQGELYSLLVDSVGDILTLPDSGFERDPASLPPTWRSLASGVHRLEQALLVELDIARVLDLKAAA